MRVLLLFLDGFGLGADDPDVNPLARTPMPNVQRLLDGRRLVAEAAPFEGKQATLLALDACLGVPGNPQSASGQATLLTGLNVPALIGEHYGPWPSPAIADLLNNDNLFRAVTATGRRAAFLNAYPPSYFAAIRSGQRRYSAVPQAAVSAGLVLNTACDLHAGRALSADFTGAGWRDRLGLIDTPLLSLRAAGERMASLATDASFAFFEYWLSDYAGHGQDMEAACNLIADLDEVLGGLIDSWDDDEGLILVTSDHGNIEDLSTRGHTTNPAPALLIGAPARRQELAASLHALPDIAPAVLKALA